MPIRRGAFAYATFYLQGREDASETAVGDDGETEYDADALAASVVSWDAVHEMARNTVESDVPVNTEWSDEAQAMADEDGIDPAEAKLAWTRGYIDELAGALEAEIVNALVDLAEEDTAVETPSGKARAKHGVTHAKRNPVGDQPSYAAWFDTGIQDCGNTYSADDFDPELKAAVEAFRRHRQDVGKLALQAVKDYWRENEAESKAEWHRQNDETVRDDGLKPDRAYEFWADGWRTQAQRYLAQEIVKRAERDD